MTQPEPPKEAPGSPLEASVAANRPDTHPEVPEGHGGRCWRCGAWSPPWEVACVCCDVDLNTVVVTTDETKEIEKENP